MSRPFPSDGLLENRPLYKVLAEVSSQQLSGILTVSGESDTVELHFNKGACIYAESHYPRPNIQLGQLLVKKGFCTPDQIEGLLQEQNTKMLRLGSLAVERGYLKDTELMRILEDQILLILFPCLTWNRGIYFFKEASDIPYDEKLIKPLNLNAIVRSGPKIEKNWKWVKERFSNDDLIPQKIQGLDIVSEGVKIDHSIDNQKTKILTGAQETIYELVDGERSIRDICDTAHLFEWFSRIALLDLQDANIISIESSFKKAFKSRDKDDLENGFISRLKESLIQVGKLAILTACIMLVGFLIAHKWMKSAHLPTPKDIRTASFRTVNRAREIQSALIVYHLFEDHFPEDLIQLAENRWIDPVCLKDGWSKKFEYIITDTGYELLSSGVDGNMLSVDDLKFSGHVRDFLFGCYYSRLADKSEISEEK
ncbi:MAG: DUF4388 domain-containing protein [bacterium]